MKAINASPEEIRKIFSGQYIIPAFQRPYSWEEDECETLWDDIVYFHTSSSAANDKYFLGTVVLHPFDEGRTRCSVIDGQQRLTTFLILIKALHTKASTVTALEECIRVKDPLTAVLTPKLRIESQVIGADKECLDDLMLKNNTSANKSKIICNYNFFVEKIEAFLQELGSSSEAFNAFILTILDRIVLLPIHCDSEDDALTIFETINNRGMSLSDSDIFKSTLYGKSKDKDRFINEWNSLEGHEELFRILMHIRRADSKETGKEIALRTFFNAKSGQLDNVDLTMESLKKINYIENSWQGTTKINIFWSILETFPNYYWKFPLFVFLHKHGEINKEGDYSLAENNIKKFEVLIENTARYFFTKGVVFNSVNTVKDTTFKVSAAVASKKNYLAVYESNVSGDYDTLVEYLKATSLGRCLKGIVLLAAYLNPKQKADEFENVIYFDKFHIEHILPQKWADNHDWNEKDVKEFANTLGNLVPFEQKLNISATNAFFGKKKQKYADSEIQDVQDLLQKEVWKKAQVKARHDEILNRLKNFFKFD